MAHKKAAGSTSLGRDSQAKRLGVKKYAGEKVLPGNIIIRQRGTRYKCGNGTKMGKDQTIFAVDEGIVKFCQKNIKIFSGASQRRQFVSVIGKNKVTPITETLHKKTQKFSVNSVK